MNYTIERKKSGSIIWSQDQKHYIISEYENNQRTLKSLSQEFHVQPQSIRNLLRKNNITIQNRKIKDFPRESHFFKCIDTSEKAYWLGMLASDGSVYKNSVRLGLKDLDHVEKFRKAIGAKNKITCSKDNRFSKECLLYTFSIRDSQMVADLKQYGIVQNKTYLGFSFPEMIPTNFYKDFIRGYFDGDGSIYFTSNKYVLSWVGNEEFLTILKKILNKPQISLCQNCKSKITYDLKISGKKDVLRILHYMYDNSNDSIRLTRKYKIVQKVFSLESANTFELVNARCE